MELPAYHPFRSAGAKERYLAYYDHMAERWPVASEPRMLDTAYGRTFVRVSGPAGAPPLVLLHGAGGNSLMWLPNVEALSACHRTYAVDTIDDCGRSVYARPLTCADDFVRWLDELFTALDLREPIDLVGLSYGGWLTGQYALRLPGRLDKIVLLAPAGIVLPLSMGFIVRAVPCLVPLRYFTQRFMYWLAQDLARKDEAGRELVEDLTDGAFMALRCFKRNRPANPTVLTDEELRGIKVPVLYLVGEHEKIYSAQKAVERLHKAAPQIQAEIMPNAGHDLTAVQSELVNRKVLEFLGAPSDTPAIGTDTPQEEAHEQAIG